MSTISTDGCEVYPDPPLSISIPIRLPVAAAPSPTIAPKIALPIAPLPPPPKILIFSPAHSKGGPA